jgi:outer membrane cobalamin receptor
MISLIKQIKEFGALLFFFGAFFGIFFRIFSPALSYAGNLPADLTKLTLEQLMDIQVTSVSKGEEDFSKAPSAIFVLTQEDIRRSGVNTIPEALRMVPGVQVSQIDSSTWAISARGFNSRFANKLLVLIDGRSVYTHAFAGVLWDEQDIVLEDVERIEVIRGPGGTLWGANAVNGVINIITKNAHKTTGGKSAPVAVIWTASLVPSGTEKKSATTRQSGFGENITTATIWTICRAIRHRMNLNLAAAACAWTGTLRNRILLLSRAM